MTDQTNNTGRHRRGAALLIVLFVVITVSTLSVGYVALSDMELGAGVNMALRYEMDYLAESGLEYARMMLLNPHLTEQQYWPGEQELELGSDGDVVHIGTVQRKDDSADNKEGRRYIVESHAYRLRGSDRTGSSRLNAEVILEPAVALWVGQVWDSPDNVLIKGDVFGRHDVRGKAEVRGNVFSRGSVDAPAAVGRKHEYVQKEPVSWPGVHISYFNNDYYSPNGLYSVSQVDPNDFNAGGPWWPTGSNPAGVIYCDQDLIWQESFTINGTLVVNGDLTIQDAAGSIIRGKKGFPALIVSGEIIIEDQARLYIEGLAQIGQGVVIAGQGLQPRLNVEGALFIEQQGIDSGSQGVRIVSYPDLAAIDIWNSSGRYHVWTPAGQARLNRLSRE